jgi:Fe-S-cluster containining protein
VTKKNKTSWYIAGLHFECAQCSNCCSGPDEGYIWITRPEIELLADFLKITIKELRQKYLKRTGLRTTIAEHPVTKDCIFLQESNGQKQCAIYSFRPNQCRTWPFWPSNLNSPGTWNGAGQKCDGVNYGRHYNFEEIERIKKTRKWWQDEQQESDCQKSS